MQKAFLFLLPINQIIGSIEAASLSRGEKNPLGIKKKRCFTTAVSFAIIHDSVVTVIK